MFKTAYQGGVAVEILDKKLIKPWKIDTGVKKEYNKEVKGYIFVLETGKGQMRAPKTDKSTLHLTQPYLVIQCFLVSDKDFHLELAVRDINKTVKRLIFHKGTKGIKIEHHHSRIPINCFTVGKWMNLSINIKSFINHCYNTKKSSFNYKSLDSISIKGNLMIKKMFTMNNSLLDTEGYADPESFKVDEIPKTMNYAPNVPYVAQVITANRILETEGGLEESKIEEDQNTTFQSESSTKYKYAFGSRVKTEEDFDKGLGIIGVGRTGSAKKRLTGSSLNEETKKSKPKTTKKRMNVASKIDNKPPKRPPKKAAKTDPRPPMEHFEEEKKATEIPVKKDRTPLEIELENQKLKLEKQFKMVSKEEDKLESIKKKRKELFSNPFSKIKAQDPPKKSKPKDFNDDLMNELDMEEEKDPMHSIKEEDEELEQYSRHMRTGSSIEDDEDPEEDFNQRQDSKFVDTDDRDDIEDLQVAGTRTQLQYQEEDSTKNVIPDVQIPDSTINREIQDNTLNRDIQNVVQGIPGLDSEFGGIVMPLNSPDETIPVSSTTNKTDFPVHEKSVTQFNASSLPQEEPQIDDGTKFSIHQEVEYPEEEQDQITFSGKKVSEEIPDETPQEEIENNFDTNPDELEEGTFQEYEFGEGDLLSRTKVFGKSSTDQDPDSKDIETEPPRGNFDTKPELTGTEKYFESPLKAPEVAPKTEAPVRYEAEDEEEKEISQNLEKYSVRNKSSLSIQKDKIKKDKPIKRKEDPNPFIKGAMNMVEGWTTTAGQELEENNEEPNFESYNLEGIEPSDDHQNAFKDNNVDVDNCDNISKDSLEEDSPAPQTEESSSMKVVYNSVLGLYYDPLTKQHFEKIPENNN
ncbi:unnamed protein product [Moneuplotes crassus]|uniref:CFA20 domain-containing protein n=1 Tax=Euplotes crassus TaxID=5936 RepID=A0AAD1Y3P2_EUPCR|nr:unnamed protein product [Moneuplotes crassus]